MKTALILGASGTIGWAIARTLLEHGYAVACHCHRNREALLQRLSPISAPYTIVQGDCTKAEQIDAIFRQTRERLGSPQTVIDCAGAALPQMLLEDVPEEAMDRLWNVNVKGPMLVAKRASGELRLHENSSLIFISSMWGLIGASCEVVYSATKGAVNAMTKALAKELAPSGIRVNAIAPGLVPSPMNSALSPEDMEAFRADTPLGAYVQPGDVTRAVLYLLESPMVTGQILSVDGGIVI